jgi:phospholipase C
MPSRFHWDYGLPKTGAFKVVGKLFLASGLCGRASGQQATADLVKRIQDSSAWDSTLIIITYDENGGRWEQRRGEPGVTEGPRQSWASI